MRLVCFYSNLNEDLSERAELGKQGKKEKEMKGTLESRQLFLLLLSEEKSDTPLNNEDQMITEKKEKEAEAEAEAEKEISKKEKEEIQRR